MEGNPVWSHVNTRPALRVPYPTTGVFPVQHLPHLPVTTTAAFPQQQPVIIEQHYAATPRELQLFPESATSEDSEPSQEHGISDHVTRPQPRYPTPTATLPVNLFPVLPGRQDQQCSSGTSDEDRIGRSQVHYITRDPHNDLRVPLVSTFNFGNLANVKQRSATVLMGST